MICYAREVISDGWPAMREGGGSPVVDARVSAMEASAEKVPVNDPKQAAAFDHWFALNEERRQGRQGRIGEAAGLVPPVVWLILIIGAVVVIASVALFADREEAAVTQAAMAAAIAIIVVSGLVLVRFLDKPYEDKSGSIKPTAMARTLAQMERSIASTVKRSSGAPTSPADGGAPLTGCREVVTSRTGAQRSSWVSIRVPYGSPPSASLTQVCAPPPCELPSRLHSAVPARAMRRCRGRAIVIAINRPAPVAPVAQLDRAADF